MQPLLRNRTSYIRTLSFSRGPPKALQEFLGRAEAQVACQWSVSGIDHRDLVAEREGKLSEWSKEPHSKCGVRITSYRGFESLTFRLKSLGASYGTPLILFREGQGLLSPRSVGSYLASLERLLLRNFRIPHFPQAESSGNRADT